MQGSIDLYFSSSDDDVNGNNQKNAKFCLIVSNKVNLDLMITQKFKKNHFRLVYNVKLKMFFHSHARKKIKNNHQVDNFEREQNPKQIVQDTSLYNK